MQDWAGKDAAGNRLRHGADRLALALIGAVTIGLWPLCLAAQEPAPGDGTGLPPVEVPGDAPADAPRDAAVDPPHDDTPSTPDDAPHDHDDSLPAIQDSTVIISGVLEPCLLPHGNPETYRATLHAVGWTDIPADGRAGALERLAEVWLPVTGRIEGSWAEHLAHRPQARAFWADIADRRTLMERDGMVLLLAGFEDLRGNLRVECWTAGDMGPMTQSFFDLLGSGFEQDGIRMTQIEVPAADSFPQTGYFIIRMQPPAAFAEHLTGGDGIRTTITFPFPTSP